MTIDEVIVVEGRDDTRAVKQAVDCETIETHGFGISSETWKRLGTAYEKRGLIILTDPDHAGQEIRRKVKERFPNSLEAFIPRASAEQNGDIGVENASPDAIRKALTELHGTSHKQSRDPSDKTSEPITRDEIRRLGLDGALGSRALREKVADKLGIGYCNANTFLSRVNGFGITRGDLDEALRTERDQRNKE